MKVMLLAAGLGERMRPLTDLTPKPLLTVNGAPLLEHLIRGLSAAGYDQLVINVSHLGQQIMDYFGDGSAWNVSIAWSVEEVPLETAGGIIQALPLLGAAPFAIVNGDIWTDYPFERLRDIVLADEQAHLVMVDNPPQHPEGDFTLAEDGRLAPRAATVTGLTYAGIGVYSPGFVASTAAGKIPLRPLMNQAMEEGRLFGSYYPGTWVDVGTPQRLEELNREA